MHSVFQDLFKHSQQFQHTTELDETSLKLSQQKTSGKKCFLFHHQLFFYITQFTDLMVRIVMKITIIRHGQQYFQLFTCVLS